MTIHTDLPVELLPESLRLDPPDTEALRALYTELEFSRCSKSWAARRRAAGATLEAAEIARPGEESRSALGAVAGRLHVALAGGEVPAAIAFAGPTERRPARSICAGTAWAGRPVRRSAPDAAKRSSELVGHDLKEVLRLAARQRARALRAAATHARSPTCCARPRMVTRSRRSRWSGWAPSRAVVARPDSEGTGAAAGRRAPRRLGRRAVGIRACGWTPR